MLNPWIWLGGMALVLSCLFSGYQYGKRVAAGEHAIEMQHAIFEADAAVRRELDLAQSRVDAFAAANEIQAARTAAARVRIAPKLSEISNAPSTPVGCKYDDVWVRIDAANAAINSETSPDAAPSGVRDTMPTFTAQGGVGLKFPRISGTR